MARAPRIWSVTLFTVLQLAAFLALFLVGGAWAEIRLGAALNAMQQHKPMPWMPALLLWHVKPTFDYVANGLVFASVLLVVILLFEALRKRFHPWMLLSVLAYVLALGYSLIRHSGFVPLAGS